MPASRGRPRRPEIDDAIRAATLDLLALGTDAVTIEAVAERSGVARSTVYRRHRSAQHLVFAAVFHGVELATPDTGSLDGDVRAIVERFARGLDSPAGRRGLFAVFDALGRDEAFRREYDERYRAAEHRVIEGVLDAAVARGELPRAMAPHLAHALLIGPALVTCGLYAAPVTDALVDALAAGAVAALRASATVPDGSGEPGTG